MWAFVSTSSQKNLTNQIQRNTIVKQNKKTEPVRLSKDLIKLQENNERSKRAKINWNRPGA